jgi:hypothetical protein
MISSKAMKRRKRIGKSNSKSRRKLKSKGNLNTRNSSRQRRSSYSREIYSGSRRKRRLSQESSIAFTPLPRKTLLSLTTILLKNKMRLRFSLNLV